MRDDLGRVRVVITGDAPVLRELDGRRGLVFRGRRGGRRVVGEGGQRDGGGEGGANRRDVAPRNHSWFHRAGCKRSRGGKSGND